MKLTPEKLSHYTLYALVGVTLAVFLAFYLAGTESSGEIYDQASEPVLVNLLIVFLFVMIAITAVSAVVMLLRTFFLRNK